LEYGLNPASTLWAFSFRSAELLEGADHLTPVLRILVAVAGLHFYLAATGVLWALTRSRLDAAKGPDQSTSSTSERWLWMAHRGSSKTAAE
jgi:hypothetical protein